MRTIAASLVAGDTIRLNGVEQEVTLAEPYNEDMTYIELGPYTDLIVPAEEEFETVELDTVAKAAIFTLIGVVAGILGTAALGTVAIVVAAIVTAVR